MTALLYTLLTGNANHGFEENYSERMLSEPRPDLDNSRTGSVGRYGVAANLYDYPLYPGAGAFEVAGRLARREFSLLSIW